MRTAQKSDHTLDFRMAENSDIFDMIFDDDIEVATWAAVQILLDGDDDHSVNRRRGGSLPGRAANINRNYYC